MWLYVQRTGYLFRDGSFVGACYSGNGAGLNNPAMQAVKSTGPIPVGLWTIIGPPYDDPVLGPHVLKLVPQAGTETFDRSEFRIHGDIIGKVGLFLASKGCIVAAPAVRLPIWDTGDRILRVTAETSAEAVS
jgi:hypothetical protein